MDSIALIQYFDKNTAILQANLTYIYFTFVTYIRESHFAMSFYSCFQVDPVLPDQGRAGHDPGRGRALQQDDRLPLHQVRRGHRPRLLRLLRHLHPTLLHVQEGGRRAVQEQTLQRAHDVPHEGQSIKYDESAMSLLQC